MVTWSGKTNGVDWLKAGSRNPERDAPTPPMPCSIRGNLSSDTALSSYCTYSTNVPSAEPHADDGAFVTSSVIQPIQESN